MHGKDSKQEVRSLKARLSAIIGWPEQAEAVDKLATRVLPASILKSINVLNCYWRRVGEGSALGPLAHGS